MKLIVYALSDGRFDWLGELEEFSTVTQTLNSVSGLHNCLEFSKLPSCLEGFVNTEKAVFCLNDQLIFLLDGSKIQTFLILSLDPCTFGRGTVTECD